MIKNYLKIAWRYLTKNKASLVIAIPIAYYFLHSWVQNYEYRTEIPWWIFVAAGIGIVVITLFMVWFQAAKAAMVNPVQSLRSAAGVKQPTE